MAVSPDKDIMHGFFPTFVSVSSYDGFEREKEDILGAIYRIRDEDVAGQQRSASDYQLGYTSYFSRPDLKSVLQFKNFIRFIEDKAAKYAAALHYDVEANQLQLSRFWVNINPKYSFHPEHIHAYSLLSGVFYVSCTPDSGGLMLKDPREVRLMTLPPTSRNTRDNADVVTLPPAEGKALIFPAWLTHSVEQNMTDQDRVSIAYNFRLKMSEA